MKPWELFKLIEDTEYISGGDDVQFAVKPVTAYASYPCA